MKRHIVSFAAAAFFALTVSSAWAQPTQDGGSRPAGSGGGSNGTSSAAPASGGGGGGSSVSGESGSTASSSPSVGSAGNSGAWGDTRSAGGAPRASAPMRGPGAAYREDGGQGRANPRGSSSGEGRATPRGSSGGDNGDQGRAVPRGQGDAGGRGTAITIDGGGDSNRGRQRAAVPEYSRPREGRTPVGTPVERSESRNVRIVNGGGFGYYYDPYYGYGYRGSFYNRYNWYPGYGFGLGYFYDPFMMGYGGYGGYYGGGYGGYYGGGGGGYYQSRGYDTGSLRLKVQPRDGKVYVDGYFVGVVDSFDGVFQKLAVEAGTHRVEIRADGFEPAQFEIMVTPGETITYKGELKRITQ